MHQSLPAGLLFLVSDLPIENLSFAALIRPQAQRDQHCDPFAALAVTLALAAILVDTILLDLHAEPDAIELHDRRHLLDWFAMHLSELRSKLVDALMSAGTFPVQNVAGRAGCLSYSQTGNDRAVLMQSCSQPILLSFTDLSIDC